MRLQRNTLILVAGLVVAGLVAPVGPAGASVTGTAPTVARSSTAAPSPTAVAPGANVLGGNVVVFTPSMPQQQIQSTVDAIAAQQIDNQFGPQRYSLLFQPGTYGSTATPLVFDVGYYTQVAGLGREPGQVTINGSINVKNQCDAGGTCIALNNFWRSLSNLTINVAGGTDCHTNTEFWAVSQAAPMRRVQVNGGFSLMDYCSNPAYASGGFIADSRFSATVVSGSQQQGLVRNSDLAGWSNGVWNQVFAGTVGAPAQSFGTGGDPYTTLPTTSVSSDAPYLYTDSSGAYRVMVPAVKRNSVGTSWSSGTTAGTSKPLADFFVANPATPVSAINLALLAGRDLLLTPGVYAVDQPIVVSRPDTVVLGLGFATVSPRRGDAAMLVGDVTGARISGIIFDAGATNSPVLLQVGKQVGLPLRGTATDPTVVQDVFFRIGGAAAGRATTSLIVNTSNVLLDDIWAWRADHGTGVGWTVNTADHGVIVNGNNVTALGLFVEHYQKTEVTWNGQGGRTVFFQNEMPYDPPNQAAWSASPTFRGYPAFVVSPAVRTFQGYGMGSYSFFSQGVGIEATTAFQVPKVAGVQMHDLLTVFLDGAGSINSVINGTGAAVTQAQQGVPSQVISYP